MKHRSAASLALTAVSILAGVTLYARAARGEAEDLGHQIRAQEAMAKTARTPEERKAARQVVQQLRAMRRETLFSALSDVALEAF
jgi:hypothetical protein